MHTMIGLEHVSESSFKNLSANGLLSNGQHKAHFIGELSPFACHASVCDKEAIGFVLKFSHIHVSDGCGM